MAELVELGAASAARPRWSRIRGERGDRAGLRVHRRSGARATPVRRAGPAAVGAARARAAGRRLRRAAAPAVAARRPGSSPGADTRGRAADRSGGSSRTSATGRDRAARARCWAPCRRPVRSPTGCWCRRARRARSTDLAPAGRYADDDVVARVGGTEVRLATSWPVRRPRPYRRAAATATVPLLTGQRVLDLLFPIARGSTRRGARRLRHRQDDAAAADRQVVRRRRHRLRRLRRARQRDGRRRSPSCAELERPAHRRPAGRPHRDHRQHLEHADDGPRGEHLHRRHRRRVLPRHGPSTSW